MREEGDEGGIGQQVGVRTLLPGAVHQEHDLLEGEEADGQREKNAERRGAGVGDLHQEVGVFEPAQQAEVAGNAADQPASRGGAAIDAGESQDASADCVVCADGAEQ